MRQRTRDFFNALHLDCVNAILDRIAQIHIPDVVAMEFCFSILLGSIYRTTEDSGAMDKRLVIPVILGKIDNYCDINLINMCSPYFIIRYFSICT